MTAWKVKTKTGTGTLRNRSLDVVDPLPCSSSGNRFILVICDYATRYPEAVPMKSVDASSATEELLKIFLGVGIPQEILTDRGDKFCITIAG